jgi:hypothetical protein
MRLMQTHRLCFSSASSSERLLNAFAFRSALKPAVRASYPAMLTINILLLIAALLFGFAVVI